jgi:hypothetical protein
MGEIGISLISLSTLLGADRHIAVVSYGLDSIKAQASIEFPSWM